MWEARMFMVWEWLWATFFPHDTFYWTNYIVRVGAVLGSRAQTQCGMPDQGGTRLPKPHELRWKGALPHPQEPVLAHRAGRGQCQDPDPSSGTQGSIWPTGINTPAQWMGQASSCRSLPFIAKMLSLRVGFALVYFSYFWQPIFKPH